MTPEQTTLIELVGRTALGDEDAFRTLYDQTAPQVLGLLVRMLQQRDLAEDVLQDTYLKVWHRAGDYHAERGQVTTWLSSIARYRALDVIRSRRLRDPGSASTDTVVDELAASAMQAAVAEVESGRLQVCMEALSGDQRQSIGLAFFRGFTHDELALHLEVPLGTAKAWVRRGLQKLRECLES